MFHGTSRGTTGELNVRAGRGKGEIRGNVLGGEGFEDVHGVRVQFLGLVLGNVVNLAVDDEIAAGTGVGGFADNVQFPDGIRGGLAHEQGESEGEESQGSAQNRYRHAQGNFFAPRFPAACLVHSAYFAEEEARTAARHGRVEHWPPAHPAVTGSSVCSNFAETGSTGPLSTRPSTVSSA